MAITIPLTAEQGEILTTDYGLNTAKVYYVDNDAVGSTSPIGGYLVGPGCYVMFVEGTEAQHDNFLKAMFNGNSAGCFLEWKGRDIWLYGTPGSKFVKPENLVTIAIGT